MKLHSANRLQGYSTMEKQNTSQIDPRLEIQNHPCVNTDYKEESLKSQSQSPHIIIVILVIIVLFFIRIIVVDLKENCESNIN